MKLFLWKPYGITSNYFTTDLKNKYNIAKICYAGRLDPLAQGLMLILTDNDICTMNTHLKHNKKYTFDIILGLSTSSGDIAGNINEEANNINITNAYIYEHLIEFIKNYTNQSYPNISSYVIKHDTYGRKPMWWYFKNNIAINIPSKPVNIYDYKICDICQVNCADFYITALQRLNTITSKKTLEDLPIDTYIENYKTSLNNINNVNNTDYKIKISMEIIVSSGFYIRQFCSDFGKYINIPSIAFDITRTDIC
jgi:tRNA pseudouridine(55) synthase